ncbi:MAG: hypothetical protein IKM30_04775 [Oscillospiraceae bacterium]|nr:hypothetical protein [Oscillospiraceae bacterium]
MESVAFKCPNCGAELVFSAAEQDFRCEYCQSSFTKSEMDSIAATQAEKVEQVSEAQQQLADEFQSTTGVYVCQSCGAEVMADDNTAATFCYYCHSPVILQGRVSGEYQPAKVIPFKIDRNGAVGMFRDWCKKRWFLPNDFYSDSQIEKLVGLYVPFWVTDCHNSADMEALGKKVRTWTSGDTRYTETKEYAIKRNATVVVRGLPADGASHIDDQLMEALEPFDYQQAAPFAMQYLSGFLAEKYDLNMAAVFPRVQKRAVQACDQLLRASAKDYSSLSVTHSDIKVLSTEWQYMMLPVWFMTYRYQDKTYEFAINGQTAKLAGEPPLSRFKFWAFTIGLSMAAALLAGIVGVFFT